MEKDLTKYITKRWATWLKVIMTCKNSIIPLDESEDLLQEVVRMLINKKENKKLQAMLERVHNGCPELEYYVIKIITNNCRFKSAYYYQTYHKKNCIEAGYRKEIEAEMIKFDPWEEYDKKFQKTPEEMVQIIRKIYDDMNFSERNREIFIFHFFEGRSYREWKGTESIDTLNKVYSKTKDALAKKIRKYFSQRGEIFD